MWSMDGTHGTSIRFVNPNIRGAQEKKRRVCCFQHTVRCTVVIAFDLERSDILGMLAPNRLWGQKETYGTLASGFSGIFIK